MEHTELELITEDDLMAMDSDARVEIIDGEIVKMGPVGGRHHFIAGNIYDLLKPFVREKALGHIFMDGLIYLLSKEGKGLKGALVPDVSFVGKANMPKKWNIDKPFPGAPTLAVEVMSPGDDATILLKKMRTYLKAGTEQVWVVYPEQAEVHQYKASTPDIVHVYTGQAELEAESLFPGLKLVVSEFFVLPNLSE